MKKIICMSLLLLLVLTSCAVKVPPSKAESKEYSSAGTYQETEVLESGIISAKDVVLENTTFTKDLVINDKVGDGDITLRNVKVQGKLIIQGGGSNSIHIEGSNINKVAAEKFNTHVILDSKTIVQDLTMNSTNFINIDGTVKNINIASNANYKVGMPTLEIGNTALVSTLEVNGQAQIKSEAKIDSITINENANGTNLTLNTGVRKLVSFSVANIFLTGGTIDSLIMTNTAAGSSLNVDEGATIAIIGTESNITISGEGKVNEVVTNDSKNIKGDLKVDNVVIQNDVVIEKDGEITIADQPVVSPSPTFEPKPSSQPSTEPSDEPNPDPEPPVNPDPKYYKVSFEMEGFVIEPQQVKEKEKATLPVVDMSKLPNGTILQWKDNTGKIVNLSDFSINADTTFYGQLELNVTDEVSFKNAIDATNNISVINLLNDVNLENSLLINKTVNIIGNDYIITSSANPVIEISTSEKVVLNKVHVDATVGNAINLSANKITLNFNDTVLKSKKRGIAFVQDGYSKGSELILDNSQILNSDITDYETSTTIGDTRGISAYDVKDSVITLQNGSKIMGFGYSINVNGSSSIVDNTGLVFNIDNSVIHGWAAFNVWGSNATYNIVNNSELVGINPSNGSSNGFATIVFNKDIYGIFDGAESHNNKLNIANSTIANYQSGIAPENLIRIDSGVELLTLSGNVNFNDTSGNKKAVLYFTTMTAEEQSDFFANNVKIAPGSNITSVSNGKELPLFAIPNVRNTFGSSKIDGFFEDFIIDCDYEGATAANEKMILLEDILYSKAVSIKYGGFSIDLDGHKLTVDDWNLNGKNVIIIDSSKDKTGKIVNSNGDIVFETVNATGISFVEKEYALEKLETYIPEVVVLPSNASGTKTWTSSNNDVATVNPTTGEITAVSSGTTVITVTMDGKSAQLTIKVITDSEFIVRVYTDETLATLHKFLNSSSVAQYDYKTGYEVFSKNSSLSQMPVVEDESWIVIKSNDPNINVNTIVDLNQKINGSLALASMPTPLTSISLRTSSNTPDGSEGNPLLLQAKGSSEITFQIYPSFDVAVERYKKITFEVKKDGKLIEDAIKFTLSGGGASPKWKMEALGTDIAKYEITATIENVSSKFFVSVGAAQTETPKFNVVGIKKIQATFENVIDEEVIITYNNVDYPATKVDGEGKIFEITLGSENELYNNKWGVAKVGSKAKSDSVQVKFKSKAIFIRGFDSEKNLLDEKVFEPSELNSDDIFSVIPNADSYEIVLFTENYVDVNINKTIEINKNTTIRRHASSNSNALVTRIIANDNLNIDGISLKSEFGNNVIEVNASNVQIALKNATLMQNSSEGITINDKSYYPVILVNEGADNVSITATKTDGYMEFTGYSEPNSINHIYLAVGSYAASTSFDLINGSECVAYYFGTGLRCGVVDLDNIPEILD